MPTLKWKEPTEAQIESGILDWLNWQPGCYAFKMHIKGTWDKRGFYKKVGRNVPVGGADILFCYRGLFGCFEVKRPSAYKAFFKSPGEHELRQQAFLVRVRNKGGLAEVVCSLDMVRDYFERWMKNAKGVL